MRASTRLSHPALLYTNAEEFVRGMVPFLREGIEREEMVFVAARADYLEAVRSELGPHARGVRWEDTRARRRGRPSVAVDGERAVHLPGGRRREGHRRPSCRLPAARGLWLARQLVDLMEILPSDRGASIRLSAPIA